MKNIDKKINDIASRIAEIEWKVNQNYISPDEAEDKIMGIMMEDFWFGFSHMDEIDSKIQVILKEKKSNDREHS